MGHNTGEGLVVVSVWVCVILALQVIKNINDDKRLTKQSLSSINKYNSSEDNDKISKDT